MLSRFAVLRPCKRRMVLMLLSMDWHTAVDLLKSNASIAVAGLPSGILKITAALTQRLHKMLQMRKRAMQVFLYWPTTRVASDDRPQRSTNCASRVCANSAPDKLTSATCGLPPERRGRKSFHPCAS